MNCSIDESEKSSNTEPGLPSLATWPAFSPVPAERRPWADRLALPRAAARGARGSRSRAGRERAARVGVAAGERAPPAARGEPSRELGARGPERTGAEDRARAARLPELLGLGMREPRRM